MIYVIALLCSINGSSCEQKEFPVEEVINTPQQCVLYGQQILAAYIADHPNVRVSKFKCSHRKEQGI